MTSFTYVDSPNDNLICCICRAPFIEPIRARTCNHTFCRGCISTALSISRQCPIDRWPLTADDLTPADPLIRNLVDELTVYCSYRDLGCSHTTQRQLLETHLHGSCRYAAAGYRDTSHPREPLRKGENETSDGSSRALAGGNPECGGDEGESNDHPPHAESNVNSSEASSSSEHDDASPIGVSCPHASNGCPWNGSRSDLDISHLPHCPFEAIKGFFDVFSSKTGALSDENAVLRRKVEALEGTVNVLMRENEEVRRALGPWYRLDHHIGENVHPSSRYTTEIITGIPERPTPRPLQRLSPTNLGTTTSAHPESTSSATPTPPTSDGAIPAPRPHLTTDSLPTSLHHGTIDTPDLAQWFPPVDVEEIGLEEGEVLEHQSNILFSMDGANAPSWDSAIVSRSPPSSHSYSYYDPHSLPHSSASVYATPASAVPVPGQLPSTTASPPHIPAVAPLNISSSLHGTLLSLRESIVTLTSAVDSLARRQDVGLATEAMRINEEIRSLRVVTHGIRVQMHSIMMDRNAQVVLGSSAPRPPVSEASLSAGSALSAGGSSTPPRITLAGPPMPFAGPRYPAFPYQPMQTQSVSGPKL